MIAQLELDGIKDRDKIANHETALIEAHRIGVAVGIIMAVPELPRARAFTMLQQASQDRNLGIRDVAEQVLLTGDIG